ncbi:unnamed protein product [Zymoseptoria tritici ST99CH_1A5]|uniref:Uncharacterized protein n=1 Tax=Zymoseptoria tritici ST99CH_1A5 TaxID=1276529 RepID=A0A1Y6LNA5_ZYMTR|nr:unnamed protein product [Zymoseptoria tritici ST99CH_1A5]
MKGTVYLLLSLAAMAFALPDIAARADDTSLARRGESDRSLKGLSVRCFRDGECYSGCCITACQNPVACEDGR